MNHANELRARGAVTVYLVHQVNCYESEPLPRLWLRKILGLPPTRPVERASLWLVSAPYDGREDDYGDVGVKLIGPAHPETVAGLCTRLQEHFRRAGITVVVEPAVDD